MEWYKITTDGSIPAGCMGFLHMAKTQGWDAWVLVSPNPRSTPVPWVVFFRTQGGTVWYQAANRVFEKSSIEEYRSEWNTFISNGWLLKGKGWSEKTPT